MSNKQDSFDDAHTLRELGYSIRHAHGDYWLVGTPYFKSPLELDTQNTLFYLSIDYATMEILTKISNEAMEVN